MSIFHSFYFEWIISALNNTYAFLNIIFSISDLFQSIGERLFISNHIWTNVNNGFLVKDHTFDFYGALGGLYLKWHGWLYHDSVSVYVCAESQSPTPFNIVFGIRALKFLARQALASSASCQQLELRHLSSDYSDIMFLFARSYWKSGFPWTCQIFLSCQN